MAELTAPERLWIIGDDIVWRWFDDAGGPETDKPRVEYIRADAVNPCPQCGQHPRPLEQERLLDQS